MRTLRTSIIAAVVVFAAGARVAGGQERPTLIIGGADDRVIQLLRPQTVIVSANRIVIVEDDAPFFRVITAAGALVQSFGRKGAGPGEIAIANFAYDSTRHEIVAFDRGNGRMSFYTLGDTVRFARSYPTTGLAWGGCIVEGVPWIISGRRTLLTELKLSADRYVAGRTIGVEKWLNPSAADPNVGKFLSLSQLVACDARTHTAVLFSTLFGEAHLLSLTSGSDQLAKILGFIPGTVESDGKGISTTFPDDHIFDELIGAVTTSAGIEALVAHYTANTHRNDAPEIRHVLLAADGTQRVVGTSKWRPMVIAHDGVYCYSDDPAPTIARYASGRCP